MMFSWKWFATHRWSSFQSIFARSLARLFALVHFVKKWKKERVNAREFSKETQQKKNNRNKRCVKFCCVAVVRQMRIIVCLYQCTWRLSVCVRIQLVLCALKFSFIIYSLHRDCKIHRWKFEHFIFFYMLCCIQNLYIYINACMQIHGLMAYTWPRSFVRIFHQFLAEHFAALISIFIYILRN